MAIPIPTDTLVYRIYHDAIPSAASLTGAHHECLHTLHQNVMQIVQEIIVFQKNDIKMQYLWNNDDFQLEIVDPAKGNALGTDGTTYRPEAIACAHDKPAPCPHLAGTTCVGDNVEDEWMIIYILNTLSQKLPVIISVHDADGEPLLIETAEALPEWLEPDMAENRVWLRDGHLCIVPRCLMTVDAARKARNAGMSLRELIVTLSAPTADEALDLLRSNVIDCVAPVEVQALLFKRLNRYPKAAIEVNCHYAKLLLPINVGIIITQMPWLVPAIVQALCSADKSSIKKATKMIRFMTATEHLVECSPSSLIACRTRFTRGLYAQLLSQHCNLPAVLTNTVAAIQLNDKEQKTAWELGMKIAIGAELLYQRAQSLGSDARHITRAIDACLKKPTTTSEFTVFTDLPADSSTEWLNLSEEQFQKILEQHKQPLEDNTHTNQNDMDAEQSAQAAKNMAALVKSFLARDSAYDGVDTSDKQRANRMQHEQLADVDMSSLIQFLSTVSNARGVDGAIEDFDGLLDIESGSQSDDDSSDVSSSEEFVAHSSSANNGSNEKLSNYDEKYSDDSSMSEIEMQLVSNMLKAFQSEAGSPGTASTFLEQLGFAGLCDR